MTDVAATRRREPPAALSDPHAAPAASSAPPPNRAPDLESALGRLPASPDYLAFVAKLSAQESPLASEASRADRKAQAFPAEAQARLDAFRDRFGGPYTVEGEQVQAPPMFRMNTPGAFNAKSAAAHAAELHTICARAGIGSFAGPASVGRPTPEQLVAVTQALIDAGKLPPATAAHGTVEQRIKAMQWTWGVGVDCAGYTQQAAAAAQGKAGGAFKDGLMGDIFTNMGRDPRFQKVPVRDVRPGDVIHLDAERGVGHNVIVFGHRPLDAEMRARIATCSAYADADAKAFLSGRGPFHVLDVDSSWGAGDGDTRGGVRRDAWVYDQSADRWGTFTFGDSARGVFLVEKNGPQNEKMAGAYRPKASP